MTEKIRVLRKKTQALDLPLRIEVDGGINDATIHTVLEAGCRCDRGRFPVSSGATVQKM